jgi:hypothetical protein
MSQNWLDLDEGDAGFQLLREEEIAADKYIFKTISFPPHCLY